jgi:hypothetical protein
MVHIARECGTLAEERDLDAVAGESSPGSASQGLSGACADVDVVEWMMFSQMVVFIDRGMARGSEPLNAR